MDVAEYNLKPGELVVMQESSVQLVEGSERQSLEEVVLTNKNLILVMSAQESLFKRTRYLKRCPLGALCYERDVPQVFACKLKGDYYLQVAFGDESITLHFSDNPRRDAERWEKGIRRAASGHPSDVHVGEDLPPEITNIVDGARDLMSGLLGASSQSPGKTGGKGAKTKPRASSHTTKKCIGCHAPISGRRGASVACPYCDTKQTL